VGYPFHDNLLDNYLGAAFSLKIDEFALAGQLEEKGLPFDERQSFVLQLGVVRGKLEQLKAECPVPPRDFDVFLSGPELAVERFKREFPEPAPYFECDHADQRLTKQVFNGGAVHAVLQCQVCGRSQGTSSKSGIDLAALPDFDIELTHKGNDYRSWWLGEKFRIYFDAINEGNEIPSFDYAAFREQFEIENPRPWSEDCPHPDIKVRLRVYSPTQNAAVQQCMDCGKHVRSIKKPAGWESLPPFDPKLEPALRKAGEYWLQRLEAAREEAQTAYKQDIRDKISRGEISVQDNSKFGSYYESDQWKRTRLRILQRDDHRCQCCGAEAECVHHIVYDRLGAENDLDLISLCNRCHDAIHREQRGLHNLYRMPPAEIRLFRA